METIITLTETEFCDAWAKAIIQYLEKGSDSLYVAKDLIKMGPIMANILFHEERGEEK